MKLSGIAVCMLLAAVLLPWISPWMVSVLVVCPLVAGIWGPSRFRMPGIGFSLCLAWVFWVGRPDAGDLRSQIEPRPQSIKLRFEIRGDADVFAYPGEEEEMRTPVLCRAFYRGGVWKETEGRLQLRLPGREYPGFLVGSVWEAPGVISPANLSYVGLYRADWKFVPDPGSHQRVPANQGSPFLTGFFKVREFLSRKIADTSPDQPEVAATLQALLLGRRSELDERTVQGFVRTGLIHVFAVSGLHLGLLSAMLLFGCRWAGLSPRFYFAVVLPLLMIFTLYTGLRASALRALIMIACLLAAAPLHRKAHLQSAFALALIIILAVAPAQVYDLGFQYSFLLVGSLLGFGKMFSERLQILFAEDPWAVPTAGRQFLGRYVRPYLQSAVLVTVLCFVVSAPLTAYTFNLFSPIGLLGNLLAVPLTFFLLASGFPALLTLFLPETVTRLAFTPARWSAEALLSWVQFLEKVPGGTQWVKTPSLWMLWMFYGLLFCWWRWPGKKTWAIAGLLGLAGYAGTSAWMDFHDPELGVIEAGRGQAAWLRLPGRGVVLVDTGSAWSGRRVTRVLQQQGIDRIDALILTHPDRYHAEGWIHLSESHLPDQILVAEADIAHSLYRDLTPPPRGVKKGDCLEIGGWNIEVLHPPVSAKGGSADDRSLVLRLTNGISSVLLMGGAGGTIEQELLEEGSVLSSRILLAGHPRNEEGVRNDFLEGVQPQVTVFSGTAFEGVSPQRTAGEHRVFEAGIRALRTEQTGRLLLKPEAGTLYRGKSFEP